MPAKYTVLHINNGNECPSVRLHWTEMDACNFRTSRRSIFGTQIWCHADLVSPRPGVTRIWCHCVAAAVQTGVAWLWLQVTTSCGGAIACDLSCQCTRAVHLRLRARDQGGLRSMGALGCSETCSLPESPLRTRIHCIILHAYLLSFTGRQAWHNLWTVCQHICQAVTTNMCPSSPAPFFLLSVPSILCRPLFAFRIVDREAASATSLLHATALLTGAGAPVGARTSLIGV